MCQQMLSATLSNSCWACMTGTYGQKSVSAVSLLARRRSANLALAENYLAQNKKGMARKDLERVLAEDLSYEGVHELAELTA